MSQVARDNDCSTGSAIARIEAALSDSPSPPPSRTSVGEFAGRLRTLRGRRNQILGANLMRDPAWDMLLDLVAAHGQEQDLCVTALCLGSGAPMTTALRQLDRLEQLGFLIRRPHPHDRRRSVVSLAPSHAPKVEALIAMFRDLSQN
ncbi:hypothetical protein PMI04_014870 [Sphingobium sp. AP49]|uniref:hypothetical protein n=1 Tax=Sphingobium sp. AP49 TaxID=1144307 RepID=UPI00026EE738|nr:hypothetical protein [Sphingobium sp. AP49]WHO37842.1 hypothetical protein PMI04_014870 [Sphingobium sp. AP49]